MTMLDERPVDDLDRPSPWSNAAMSSVAEIGRWRLSARLARREIRRRPWRTVLVVLLIGVPVAGMVVGDAGYRSSQLSDDQSHYFGTAAGRITASGLTSEEQVDDLLPADVSTLWGGEAFFLPLRSTADPDTIVNVDLSTLDMADPMAAGIARPTEGRLPTAPDEVFLNDRVADLFGVGVGDTLELVRPAQRFEVVGIGTADGYFRLMAAPGFDLSVLRPQTMQRVALADGPSVRDGSLSAGQVDPDSPDAWMNVEYPSTPSVDHLALFLGWVFSIMLMAVLGIVVSAAFAVSGRRQLVTIGQLSASGSDPAVLRRYLALQGTWSGLLGVVVGVSAGLAIVPRLHSVIANDGRTAIGSLDLVVIALTALLTATLAAIVPTRDLARTSVLAALGGRRPVAAVRPRQVRIGALLVAGGLTALWLAVSSARYANDSGDGLGAAIVLAGAGGLAVLAGMCCVCPVVVDLVARVGSRRRGATRLATRGLGRHRARSAALIAAIAAIGAAAMAAGATAEHEFAARQQWSADASLDQIEISSTVLALGQSSGGPPLRDDSGQGVPTEVDRTILDQVDAIVGPVSWFVGAEVVGTTELPMPLLVADDGLLDHFGISPGLRAALAEADVALIEPPEIDEPFLAEVPSERLESMFGSLDIIELTANVPPYRPWLVITPEAVDRLDLDTRPSSAFGRLPHDVTRAQYDALTALSVFSNESAYFLDVPAGETSTFVTVGYPDSDYSTLTRLIILGGMLLLTMIVVGVGMALWAAEGKDERDALVSIGASPSVLARVVGLKAWLLAFVGGVDRGAAGVRHASAGGRRCRRTHHVPVGGGGRSGGRGSGGDRSGGHAGQRDRPAGATGTHEHPGERLRRATDERLGLADASVCQTGRASGRLGLAATS